MRDSNFSEVFIRRPIATSLLMFGIALFGLVAYRALPVSDLPNVDYPTIQVSASLPGASPETMSSAVATPLERQFTGIAGLDSMTSTNGIGATSITLQFDLDRKVDGAEVDVQTAISEALPLLPPGLSGPPSFHKHNPSDEPVMFMSLTSPTLSLYQLDEYAEIFLAQRLSMVEGVAQVFVMGSQKYAVHVQVDPMKLNARQLGINEVSDALQNWNVNLPTGTLNGRHEAFNVQANGQLRNAAAFRPLVVAWRNGAPVRLSDIASVTDGVEDAKTASWLYTHDGGRRAINLLVFRQPGSNTIEVADAIRALLPTLNRQLPPSVSLQIRGDHAQNIREAFQDMKFTMVVTLALVVMVIFLFLRNASATLIPSLALPFSIIGTFSIMYVLNFSLDTLSMMALILSIGFVVDDAIVMLENIVRHLEKGLSPVQAALRGSREIWSTILSMTLSLAAVFIPVLFMGGVLGRLFREFAVTICVAILISGFVSVTLTPMLCSRLLRSGAHAGGVFYRVTEGAFQAMLRFYDRSLWWVLAHRPVMAGIFVAILVATGYLYVKVPKGFVPESDSDRLSITTEAQQGVSYEQLAKYQQQINNIVSKDPNVASMMASVGGSMAAVWGGSNTGRAFVQLVPRSERRLSAQQVVEELRPKVTHFPGVRVFMVVPPDLHIGGHASKSSFEFTVQGPDTTALYNEARHLQSLVAKLPIVNDVTSDLQMRSPRVRVVIDRDKTAAYGLNPLQIEGALYQGYGPSWASTIYTPASQYKVLLEVLPKYQSYPDLLSLIDVKTPNGMMVPLDAVTRRVEDVGPQTINHSGQLPSVSISFNLKPGVSLGEAVDQISALSRRTLPATMTTRFAGTALAFQSSLQNLGLLLIIAVAVVYIVLGVLYESYIHPLTILSGLPSAGFGALLTLWVFHVELTIYAFVGLIMLIGLVKKNAIMQIDFALAAERNEGKSALEAIHEGCMTRFRPIMMTTMAALLGAMPLAIGAGAGGEMRRPLGLTVAGGLLFSQLLTLYLTPVVYLYMDGMMARWRRSPGTAELAPAAAIPEGAR